MKVLVTGIDGQLGHEVAKVLDENKVVYFGTDRSTMDITNEKLVKRVIFEYAPNIIIHCAAYTAVDQAEEEKELCHRVNVVGTKNIAEATREINAKMVYISTDYVFDGESEEPYKETDKPKPINYYGQTKYEGELEVQKALEKYFIIRISWLFGIHGNNFVKTMLKLGAEKDEISVVSDQIGSPTYAYDAARAIYEIMQTEKYGIYHVTNDGYCSWYEFALEIFKQANLNVKVRPIRTEEYPTKARRPKNSRLLKTKIIDGKINLLSEWQIAITRFMISLI